MTATVSRAATRPTWLDEAKRELTEERRRATRYMRRAEDAEQRNIVLVRRLAGALYQIYGDWDRVNKELAGA